VLRIKRALVYAKDFTLNIEATEIEKTDKNIFIWNGDKIVGIFKISIIQAVYLTTKSA